MTQEEDTTTNDSGGGGGSGSGGGGCVLSIDVGRKNLALCLLRPGACRSGAEDRIAEWVVTACQPTPAGIAAALRSLPWASGPRCAEVVIERQPNRNPTMTRLQHYLEMYFVVHDKPVVVQDAKHKLAYAASTRWWPGECAKWTYHARKKLSVQTTEAFLGDTPQASSFKKLFAGTSKKDDLGDSLLQCMAYCHNLRPALRAVQATTAPPREKIKPRRPTDKQLASGKFSRPNIVHFLKGCRTREAARARAARNEALARSLERQFPQGLDDPDLLASLNLKA
jgi:hypothetical protein